MNSYVRKTRMELQMKQGTLAQLSGVPKTEDGNGGKYPLEVYEALAKSMNVDVSVIADWKIPEEIKENPKGDIKDNHLASNTEGIKRALRKNLEILAKELSDHPENSDEDRFKIANAIFDYSEMLLKVDLIDEHLQK